MGMKFTVTATAKATVEDIDISDLALDAGDILDDASVLGYGGIEVEDAEITGGSVTVEARVRIEDVEVSASDISDYDASAAFEEHVDWNVSISDADFDIEDSPTGFDEVEQAVGRDIALSVYAALDAAGFEVN